MNYRITMLLAVILLTAAAPPLMAGPGDTVKVKTFTFSQRAPYDAKFLFPPKDKRYEKILMYYTLKCNPEQSPACGEWDYLTYTYLYEHTGRLDSTRMMHPWFKVNNATRDTVSYVLRPTFQHVPRVDLRATRTDTSTLRRTIVGAAGDELSLKSSPVSRDGRAQFSYLSNELRSAGLTAGAITGIAFNVRSAAPSACDVTIRLRRVFHGDWQRLRPMPRLDSLVTVFRGTVRLSPGWQSFPFSKEYPWSGADSALVVDVSLDAKDSVSVTLESAFMPFLPGGGGTTMAFMPDIALDFAPVDEVHVPVEPLAALDTQITVAFWQFGDPDKQPRDASVFEGVNSKNQRVVNAHVPWSNGRVYWDAGTDGAYDRIDNAAQTADFEGRWNHWAFTKNAASGEMRIYLNGALWFSGTGKTKSMSGITRFRIGASASGSNYYDGAIDDFAVFNSALTADQISDVMLSSSALRNRPDCVAFYDFEDASDGSTTERITGTASAMTGYPLPVSFHGDRVKNFSQPQFRPQIAFEQGGVTRIDSVFIPDSAMTHPMMIVIYGDTTRPNIPTDTLYRWAPVPRSVYDASGRIVDVVPTAPDSTLIRKDYPYYSPPFEVVNRWEIGRFITPYGNGLDLGEGWTWVYDISDFRPLLSDSVHLSAGNWQELLDLTFVFIEGTPPRDVKSIRNVWNGNWGLNAFAERVPPKTLALDPGASAHRLKITTTGHGMVQPNNCAEFCPKIHSVNVNGVTRWNWQIIEDCAMNPLYPQGGTWIYARAGWCPGAPCTIREFELTPYVSGDSMTIDYNAEYDVGGNYIVESQLVAYGPPNFSLDAAVVEIIRPNDNKLYTRNNPSCREPRIRIRNTGATTLTTLDIVYGPNGGPTNTFTWNGTLRFLEETDVSLPSLPWLASNLANTFTARVTRPNGGMDEHQQNDAMTVSYAPVSVFNKDVLITFQANAAAYENYYEVLDASGNRMLLRQNLKNNAIVRDTLRLPPGCYELILHDSGDDGLYFFSFNNDGTGSMSIKAVGTGWPTTLKNNFGREIRHQFMIVAPNSVERPADVGGFALYPNPTSDHARVEFTAEHAERIAIDVVDMLGRTVLSLDAQEYERGTHARSIPLRGVPSGEYLVRVIRDGRPASVMHMKLVR